MSNEVYGYAVLPDQQRSLSEVRTPLGVHPIQECELYGFEEQDRPQKGTPCFLVGDRPDSRNATYLVDLLDYADGASIGMPLNGVARLELLHDLVRGLFDRLGATKVVLAVTDASEIDERKAVTLDSFLVELVEDCREMAPPCCLYTISR